MKVRYLKYYLMSYQYFAFFRHNKTINGKIMASLFWTASRNLCSYILFFKPVKGRGRKTKALVT